MSNNLPELQRIRRERREDVRTWGAGHGGRMGTPSPMYGTRSGGMPQPSISLPAPIGESVTLPVEGVSDGLLQFGGPVSVKTSAPFLGYGPDGPTTGVFGYHDVILDLQAFDAAGRPVFDAAPLRLYADEKLLQTVDADFPWATLHIVLPYDVSPSGTQLRVGTDHPAEGWSGWANFRLVDTPRRVATDPPPPPPDPGDADGMFRRYTLGGDFTVAIPSHWQPGDLVVGQVWFNGRRNPLPALSVDGATVRDTQDVDPTSVGRGYRQIMWTRVLTAGDLSAGHLTVRNSQTLDGYVSYCAVVGWRLPGMATLDSFERRGPTAGSTSAHTAGWDWLFGTVGGRYGGAATGLPYVVPSQPAAVEHSSAMGTDTGAAARLWTFTGTPTVGRENASVLSSYALKVS
jgi:hypothetical protein